MCRYTQRICLSDTLLNSKITAFRDVAPVRPNVRKNNWLLIPTPSCLRHCRILQCQGYIQKTTLKFTSFFFWAVTQSNCCASTRSFGRAWSTPSLGSRINHPWSFSLKLEPICYSETSSSHTTVMLRHIRNKRRRHFHHSESLKSRILDNNVFLLWCGATRLCRRICCIHF